MGDAEVDHGSCARCDRRRGRQRLLLELHALAHAEAGGAGAVRLPGIANKSFVEMDMAIDEARQHQPSAKIVRLAGPDLALQRRSHRDDLSVADGDVDDAPVGQPGIAEEGVDGGQCRSPVFIRRQAADLPNGLVRLLHRRWRVHCARGEFLMAAQQC